MSWTSPIDAYCERLGPGFWAEPVNAVSNLAFVLAAILAVGLWRRAAKSAGRRPRDTPALLLILLVGTIGVGSFLFHTFATRWSALADVLPIAVFIYAYFGLALHRFAGVSRLAALGTTLLFFGFSFFAEDLFGGLVGSSASYVPALLALVGIGVWLVLGGGPQGSFVLAAGGVFAVSLALRIADMPACADWPLGTHFLWHILNAVTLGLLLVAAIRQGPSPRARRITA